MELPESCRPRVSRACGTGHTRLLPLTGLSRVGKGEKMG